jgi:hypothetical protein
MTGSGRGGITCIMVIMDPLELRCRADHYREIALDGDDMHLKVALRQLADEYDREAAAIETRLMTNNRPIAAAQPPRHP